MRSEKASMRKMSAINEDKIPREHVTESTYRIQCDVVHGVNYLVSY